MIKLNDYLYDGHTIFRIIQMYTEDLEDHAMKAQNKIDLAHCAFLTQMSEILEHNEFLTSQSNRIKEFYKYMVEEYPYLAFTFKGRIKSIIRAEEKFNRYIVNYTYDYYKKNNKFPEARELKERLSCFRDFIAYRIVISYPKCSVKEGKNKEQEELRILYEIANKLPYFLETRGFQIVVCNEGKKCSPLLDEKLVPYYRDYIEEPAEFGYQSLHLTVYDEIAHCYTEVQLRTKEMDDYAEIGPANHLGYEKAQELQRTKRSELPTGECIFFDEAFERVVSLESLELAKLDVNMFAAANNSLINDGCGLFRGRQILPFEHLSRYQTGAID